MHNLELGIIVLMIAIVISVGGYSYIEVQEFSQKCKEAGGIVSKRQTECFHPSAIINVE